MAENDIAIQVGVVLNTEDIGKQLAKIKPDKNNSIKISANLEDVKREVKKYKESLGKEGNAAKLLIDVLKGQSDNKIKDYIDSIHEKYVKSPIKITLDVDTQATTANINKAVGEMQQQVQKAVDQAVKSVGSVAGSSTTATASSSLSLPNASGDTKYWNELNDAIRRYSSAFDDVSAKVASWRISEDMEGNARAAVEFKNSVGEITTAIFRLQDALDAENKPILDENGNTIKEWVEVGNQYTKSFQAAEQAARKMYEELNKGYRESEKQAEQQYQMFDKMFVKLEQNAQRTSDYLSKQEAEFNKLYYGAFEGKNPLEGLYAKEAESALNVYKAEIEQIKSSGETVTAEQKARIQQLHDYAQKVIEDQKRQAAEVRTYYNDLNKEYRQSEKQRSSDQQMYDKMLIQREQEFQKLADQMSKYEAEFNKLYIGAFEGKNPLTGEFADKALDALQKYQDEYQNVMKAGTIATDEQIRKINELRDAASLAITQQQALQQKFISDKRQDYSGLFGQSKEWEAALKQITDAENKLNEIQKNAFSGTNALTGDFAKEATRQIDEVKNKFAEIRKTAEESFGGAATVSKDALKKMVDDLKSDLDRLAKLEYPSDKLAAQNVDVKKAFAADALAEMEERLKSLGDNTTEYYKKVQDLKTILSTVGQVDSDPSAWAKFRNEFHMLEDEIKKFEASAQGMGQKLAAGLENNQLQQITEMVDRLNNIDEKFNGAGVERLQQSLQSLAQEYMNVIEQLKNPNLSKDEYDALASKVKELSDQFKQAQNAVRIFNDGFKNEGDLRKYEQNADALRMKFEQLQNTYANLASRNPEIAERFREVENAINGMDPKNIAEVSRQVGNLAKECGNASGQSAGLRGALTDAFGGLGSYLARFTSSYYIITKTIQGIKKMVDAVKEVDTSLVELQKVTNLTGDSLAQFTDKAYQMGAQLGRTGKDVIDAATTFSRAGYDLNEATQLAQSALVMTNVGVDIPNMESAASDMISILKAFDIQAEESMDVIDKLYNVANKEPLDFGNITQMLVTAGGTLAQSGTKLEESMGLLTGAFATLRNSSVANGLIFISQRLRGLDEDGEAIDGLVPKLQALFSSVGINIEDQNGELRSTFDILQDLAAVWDQLSSKQKQYFGEKAAGNRQVKTLNAIMQNWDVVADTIDKANNAQGEALKGNEMYMDSIQGRMTQLQSAFQELAKSTIDSDFVKNIVSLGTSVLKLISDLGGLPPVLTTILGVILAIKGADIVSGIAKIGSALAGLFSSFSLAAGLPGILIAIAGAVALVVNHINNANSSLAQFEKAKESYEEHKTKVESLNNELKTTQDRIAELEGKDSLTIIEKTELDRLKDVNQELRDQIELETALQNIALSEERRNAANYLETKMASPAGEYNKIATKYLPLDYLKDNTSYVDNSKMRNYGMVTDADQLMPNFEEKIKVDMAALDAMLEKYIEIQSEIRRVSEQGGDTSLLTKEKAQLDEDISVMTEELRGFYNTINEKTKDFNIVENAVPGSVEDRMNKLIQLRQGIEDIFKVIDSRPRATTLEGINKEINDVINKYPEAVKKVQEQIKESSDGWELDIPEDLAQELMSKFDLTLEEVKQLFMEKYGPGSGNLQLTVGTQMSVEVEDVVNKLFQSTDGYTKVLTKALSEQEKAGTLTGTTIQKLLSADSGLPGIADCLEKTAAGYRLNTERVNEYVNAQNADMRLNAVAGIMERQIAIENLTASLDTLTDAEARAAVEDQIANYENDIVVLQAMADEAYNAVDALDALSEATKTPNEDANQNKAKKELEAWQEAWDAGKIGTDDFKKGMDYLLGENWYEDFKGKIGSAVKEAEKLKKRYFAEDDADSAQNFMKDLASNKLAEYNPKTGAFKLLTDDLTEVAKKLGISETAAKNLFELLNAYEFKNKITIGDDAIDSVEKLEAAQKKLDDLEKQIDDKNKELQKAQQELDNATDDSVKKEKAEEIKALNEELAGLSEQYNGLAASIDTANEALKKEDTETPKTLEEALAKIQEYQNAITALNENGISTPVELKGDYDTIVALLSDPKSTLTVNATPGNVDPKIEELESLRKAIDENPEVSTMIKATVDGITNAAIEGLKKFNGEVREIEGKKYVQSRITVAPSGIKHATVEIKKVKDSVDELDKSDPTVDIKAEKDKSVDEVKEEVSTLPSPEELTAMYMGGKDKSVDETKEELVKLPSPEELTAMYMGGKDKSVDEAKDELTKLPSPEELTAMYLAGVDQGTLNQAEGSIQAVADKEYTATIKAKLEVNGVEPVDPANLTEDQWREYQERIGDSNAIPMILGNDSIVLPPVDREALSEDINSAIKEVTNSDDSNFITFDVEPDEDFWRDKLDNLTEDPLKVDLETEQTPEEDAQNYKELWDAFFKSQGLEVPVDANVNGEEVTEEVEEAIEEVPRQEIEAGVNKAQITEQVETAIESANPSDVTVNVQQRVQGDIEKPKDTTQTVTIKGKDAGGTQAVKNIKNEAEEGAVVPIDADTTEAEKKDDSLIGKIKAKVFKLLGLDTGLIYREADEVDKRLAQKVQKTVEITYRETNQRPYAKGTKKAEEGVSLVDEEGAELIEHTKQGTFELGSNNGARFTHLDKDDVVHTAEETKKILTRAASIGGFFRDGLNRVKSLIGDAFASGTRVTPTGPMRILPKKKKEDDKKKTTRGTGSGSGSGSGSNSGDNNSDTSAWTNWTKQFFDWVEVKLKRLQSATKTLTDRIDEAVGAAAKNAQIQEVLKSIGEQIEANKQGYEEYMKMANKIGEHLDTDIVNKIKNGTIDISQYDDLTQQKIRDYQTWYEKALACGEAIADLKKQEQELAKQTLKNIADQYDAELRLIEARQGTASSERELEAAKGRAVKGPEIERQGEYEWEYDSQKGEFVKKQKNVRSDAPYGFGEGYGDYTKEIREAENRQIMAQRQAESLQEELDQKITDGVIKVGDDTWTSYKEKIEAAIKSANQAGIEAERLKDEAYAASMAPLEYQLDKANYEESKKAQEMELGNTRGSLGDKGKRAAYQSLIEGNESQNETLKIQNDLYRQLQGSLDKDSAEYQELEKKIRDNEAAMLANEQQTEEWNKAMQNLDLAKLGRELDALTEKSDRLNHSLSVKMISGIEITEKSYQKLIDTAKESQDVLRAQNAEYSRQQRKLVKKYGEDAKTSDEYLALEAKKNANKAQIRNLDMSILQWEDAAKDLDATKIGWQLDGLKTKAQELADELARKKSLGIEIDTSDYEAQIANAEEQKRKLLEQNAEYLEKQAGMDVNSEAYQELQSKIDANNASMRQLDEATVQWKKDMADLPVKELGYELDDLNFQSDSLEKNLDIKRESGKFVSEDDYKKQIALAQAEKAVLQAQNEEWEKQQAGMDENSDAYQELQKKINANKKTMQDLDKATIKWGKDIKQIKIDEINTTLDNLKAEGGVLGKRIDIKNARGQYVSEADYRNQIQNNNNQAAATSALIEQLRRNQAGMDVNSDEYRNLQKDINSATAALLDLELSNVQLEKTIRDLPLTNLGYDIDRSKVREQEQTDAIDYKKLTGKQLSSTDYNGLLLEAQRQRAQYQQQIAQARANQAGMDFYSPEYQNYQKQIDAAEQEVRNIDKKVIELRREIANLAIENLGWQIDELDAQADKVSNLMDLNATQGYDEEASAYKSLIENGSKRIRILEEENRLLRIQQAGMDKMSEAYQNIERQIEANNNEIAKTKISQEEWNDSIIDIGIGNIKKYKDALSRSNDQLKKQKELQEAILEVEKATGSQRKIRTYVEGRGFVYQHDENEIRKAQESLEDVVRNQLMDKLDDLIDALEDAKKNSNVYDKNGNLIGTAYSTPQLGNLSDILSNYYRNNSNTTLDIGTLRQTLGNNIIPNNSNKTSFNIGDIIINEVKNGNELAQTIVEQFPNALLQALYGK